MLPFKILTQTPFAAITLAEGKSQCNLMPSNDLDDDLISGLIIASASAAQEYLHWMVSEGTVKQYSSDGGTMQLYGTHVTAITEVTATNATGDVVTLTTDDYSYNDVTEEVFVDSSLYYDVNITYACGATKAQLPACVKQGMLLMVSTMYNSREDFVMGLSVATMPITSEKLLSLRRHYVS